MKWKSMKSAPKTGELILGSDNWGFVAFYYWDGDFDSQNPKPYWHLQFCKNKKLARAAQPAVWKPTPTGYVP